MIQKYCVLMILFSMRMVQAADSFDDKMDTCKRGAGNVSHENVIDDSNLRSLENNLSNLNLYEDPTIPTVYLDALNREILTPNIFEKLKESLHQQLFGRTAKAIMRITPLKVLIYFHQCSDDSIVFNLEKKRKLETLGMDTDKWNRVFTVHPTGLPSKKIKDEVDEISQKIEQFDLNNNQNKNEMVRFQEKKPKNLEHLIKNHFVDPYAHLSKNQVKELRKLTHGTRTQKILKSIEGLFPKELGVRALIKFMK